MPGIVIGIAAALLAALLLTLIIRAALFRPEIRPKREVPPVEADGAAAAGHLSALIRQKTVSSRDAEEIDTAQFDGLIALLPELYPKTHRALSLERVNGRGLLYHWKGRQAEAPTVLMAHYDVVPAPPEGWRYPPFSGQIAEGKIWGRGALDTKVTFTAVFEAVERLLQEGFTPERDLWLSFSNNEEIMGDSAKEIVALFRSRGITPGLVLDEGGAVVENVLPGVHVPSAMVGLAEKGVLDLRMRFDGMGGHSSTPMPGGPVARLARAVTRLEKRPFAGRFSSPTKAMFTTLGGYMPFGYRLIFGNLWLFEPLLVKAFSRMGGETAALCRTTVAVTMLKASDSANVLPASARAVANLRIAVGETAQQAADTVRRIVADPGMTAEIVFASDPSPVSRMDCPAYETLRQTIEETYPEAVVSPYVMLGASDSRHYAAITPFVYRFSPLALSKAERESMHAVNESVPVEKLAKCVEFYIRLIRKA